MSCSPNLGWASHGHDSRGVMGSGVVLSSRASAFEARFFILHRLQVLCWSCTVVDYHQNVCLKAELPDREPPNLPPTALLQILNLAARDS